METRFLEELKNKHIDIQLEYYGKNDISTGWDVKTLLDNKETVIELINDLNDVEKYSFDDYFKYFYLLKISKLAEILPLLKREEDVDCLRQIIEQCNSIIQKINIENIIKYLNNNIREIFEYEDAYSLKTCTFEFIKLYINGIKPEVIKYLCENYGYLVIQRFSDFEDYIEKQPEIFEVLFSDKNINIYHSSRYVKIYDILAHLMSKEKSKLKTQVDDVNFKLHEKMIELSKTLSEDNALILQHQVCCYNSYLKKIKSPWANEFCGIEKKVRELIKNSVSKNDYAFSYEIPTGKILELWEKTKEWEIKLLSITHNFEGETKKIKSRLSRYEKDENKILHSLIRDEKIDDYFTYDHKMKISISMSVGMATIMAIYNKSRDEFIRLIISEINFLSQMLNNEAINKDVKRMLVSVDMVLNNSEKQSIVQESLLYNASIQICACIEKLIRLAYIEIFKDDIYIPLKIATLGSLISCKQEKWKEIFDYNQLQTIGYYLISLGDKEIGFNYRNRLAHLEDEISDFLQIETIGELLYLFTDVANTVFAYYLNKNEINKNM